MPQNTANLTPKQAKFVSALLKHYTLEATCRELGISNDTGRRMMQQEEVKQYYEAELQVLLDVAVGRLYHLVESAIDVLSNSLSDPEPNAVRLRAASIILEKTLDLRSRNAYEERLATLEAVAKQGSAPGVNHHGKA